MPGLFHDGMLPYLRQAGETYSSLLKGHPLSFAVFKQAPWHHYGLLALEQTQVSLRSPYLDNELVRTVFRAPESAVTSHDLCLRLIAEGSPALSKISTDRGVGGTGLSGAVSRKFLEFQSKAEYAYDYGMPQRLAQIDHILSPFHLERLFLGRHKFNHYRVWYRDALAGYVRKMLLDPRTLSRPYLERYRVEDVVQGHLKGNRNYTNEIHYVLTLELLHRLFIDPQ
jgi:asparagine synthase (glutamine-hydrolysing)